MEMIFGSVLALICLLFGTVLGATLKGFGEADPYAGAISHPDRNTDIEPDTTADSDPTTLEQATTYRTGDIHLHVVEINGRHWVSADPDLGDEFHKYLSGDVYRTIQEYETEDNV